MSKGWVKLHRNIMNSDTFSRLNAIQQLIAIYIILNANHEDGVWFDKYKNIEVPVKRGQLVTSRKKIANEWFKGDKNITEQKIRTTLSKLEKLNFLTIKSTNNYTLLEVCNYNVYQSKENESNQRNNQEITKEQPRDNQEITTNKNDKELNKNNAAADARENFENELIEKYKELRARYFKKYGIVESPSDFSAAKKIKDEGVDLENAIRWLEGCFESFQPKYPSDTINSLGYCVGYILDRHHESQNKVVGLTQNKRLKMKDIDWSSI